MSKRKPSDNQSVTLSEAEANREVSAQAGRQDSDRRDSLEPEINAEWEKLPEIEKLRRNVIYWMKDSCEKQKRNYELRQELLRERERVEKMMGEE